MDNKVYSITLADGTVLSGLILSGTNFITTENITKEMFEDNCSPVVINDGETDELHENMELVVLDSYEEGKAWFALRDFSEQELKEMQMQSDIEYVAMMAGIEL